MSFATNASVEPPKAAWKELGVTGKIRRRGLASQIDIFMAIKSDATAELVAAAAQVSRVNQAEARGVQLCNIRVEPASRTGLERIDSREVR